MKKLILLSLILFSYGVNAQWHLLNGPEGSGSFVIAKTSYGIFCGTSGGMYVSQNDGNSWQIVTSIPYYSFIQILSVNDTLIAAYTVYDAITEDYNYYSVASFDHANTWTTPSLYTTSSTPLTLIFVNHTAALNSRIYAFAESENFFSDDYGQTWSTITSPNSDDISDLQFLGNYIFLSTTNYTTYHTERYVSVSGSSGWQLVDTFPNVVYTAMVDSALFLSCVGSQIGISGNYCLRTFDFGQHWDTIFTTPDTALYGLSSEDNSLYRYTQQFVHSRSTDYGNTWTPSRAPIGYDYGDEIPLSNGDFLGVNYVYGLVHYVAATDTFYSSVTGILSQVSSIFRSYNNVLFISAGDGFFASFDAGLTWTKLDIKINGVENMSASGDTIVCVSDSKLSISLNGGISWDSTSSPPSYNYDIPGIEIIGSRIYYSASENFYSDDMGHTWNLMATIIPDSLNCPYPVENGIIRSDGNDLFIATNEGHVYKYDAANNNWIYSFCFFSPGAHNGNYIYHVDNYLVISARLGMYTSNDHGSNWQTAALAGVPTGSTGELIVPRTIVSANGLWFGSCGSAGIFASSDHGNNWFPIPASDFPPGGVVLLNNILYSSSQGRGVWKRDGTFRQYSGRIYLDENQNNLFDAGDRTKAQLLISTSPSSRVATTDSLGNYQLVTDAVGDVLSPELFSPYVHFTPSMYSLDSLQLQNLDFAVAFNSYVSDLAVDITPVTGYLYADTSILNLTVENRGTLNQNGSLALFLPSAQIQYISSSPAPAAINGDTLFWNIDSLDFLERTTISVNILTLSSNFIGDTVVSIATITPSVNDSMPQNNNSVYKDFIRGSFDPNDKTCIEGDVVTTQQLITKDDFNYVVRFQNTGNIAASTVSVMDTLSNFLDWSTLHIISSSHPAIFTISENGIARFDFPGINLPDSGASEMNSHGFVKYNIHARPYLQSGNAITNTAYIYFDSNPAIITNTATTIIVDELILNATIINYRPAISTTVYPNPTSDFLNISVNGYEPKKTVRVFNSFGRILQQSEFSGATEKININTLAEGIYIGSIYSSNGEKISSFRFVISR